VATSRQRNPLPPRPPGPQQNGEDQQRPGDNGKLALGVQLDPPDVEDEMIEQMCLLIEGPQNT
jgi:hypothetical protein